MKQQNKKIRIFLSAAEPSADSHCANLISELKKLDCDIEFVGVGGPKMAEQDCHLIQLTTDKAAMTYKAFAHIFSFLKLILRIKQYFKKNSCDLVILCDSPAFNFHVAKAAKKNNIKTLFYVAPQLWAWAPWRIKKLKRTCDKLCCILPFEEKWFSDKGMDVCFVGNPLLEGLDKKLDENKKNYDNFDITKAKIALMPGSRPAEIQTLWEPMQQIAAKLRRKYPSIQISTVAVDLQRKEILRSTQILGFGCKYIIGDVAKAAAENDLCLVASGSATLQIASAGCPMVIMYQTSKRLWHLIGKRLIRTKHLSLVNILAEKELVPEFMPYFSSIDPVLQEACQILSDKQKLTAISSDLIELVKPLSQKHASKQTASIIAGMLDI